ncbi:MAG: hypothetical protein IPK87_03410 [Planctomycetes bacterium]|nr:hypothetical protein [Planctomycetota bacterium]
MRHRRHNRLAVAALLLGALAGYCDLPRLHVFAAIGDTVNAIRVLDVASHIRMATDAMHDTHAADMLREKLDDGRGSADIINFSPSLVAALPPLSFYVPPTLAPDDSTPGLDFLPAPLTGLPGMLMQLDLPPPRLRSDTPAPAFYSPANLPAFIARGPPMRFGF